MIVARKSGIDVVKAFAVLFVPSVHFFLNTSFYSTPLAGNNMFLQVFMRSTFLICVPLFLIITGYLQGNKKPEKAYFKKILPIIYVYAIYAILSVLVREFYFNEHRSLVDWLELFLSFKANSYAWYVNMYIGLFLFSPYLNLIYKGLKTKKDKLILIGILLFLTSVPDLLNGKARGVLHFPDYWKIIYPLTYYFIGLFIKEYQFKIRKRIGLPLFVALGLFATLIEFHYANGGKFLSMAGYYPSPIIVLSSVIFFLMFYQIDIRNKFVTKALSIVSILSLDIYLSSYIVDCVVYKFVFEHYFQSQQQVLLLFVPVVLSTLVLSFLVSFIRHKIIRFR